MPSAVKIASAISKGSGRVTRFVIVPCRTMPSTISSRNASPRDFSRIRRSGGEKVSPKAWRAASNMVRSGSYGDEQLSREVGRRKANPFKIGITGVTDDACYKRPGKLDPCRRISHEETYLPASRFLRPGLLFLPFRYQ